MKISKDTVVSMHYTLTDNNGTTLDSSEGREPLTYLQGHQNIIPGLESEMEGKEVGAKFIAKIPPSEAYGELNQDLIQKVPKSNFPNPEELQPGMQFQTQTEMGPMVLTVKEIADSEVTVDGNHPLAGVELNFEVEITNVRAATQDEISHGHVHGEGCSH